MRYTSLGNIGLIVSRLSFGAMTFGSRPSIPAILRVDEENARTISYAGGQSEMMLGKLLAGRRHDVVIATKVGFRTGESIMQAGLSRRHIFASCDGSLRRLNTDHIDLYIAHKEDPFTPLEETLEALNDLVRMGKVRFLGFSNRSAWKAAIALHMQKVRGWAQFTSGQMNYSLQAFQERGRDLPRAESTPLLRRLPVGSLISSVSPRGV